jgi:hypothetical protein
VNGFNPRFTDLPDYILKCTAQIWEGRDIAALDWHYGENLIVRTPAGINHGNAAGKANTMAALSEFPDRQLLGEDVIWCGDDQSGFLSSHRIVSTATHSGGSFGPATGRPVTFRTIADTLPCGVEAHGTSAAKEFYIGLRSALPSASFKIEHQIGRHDQMLSPRSAIRWSLTGKHEGYGRYGTPTGAEVHVMGVSHAEFGPWGLRRETTLIDDIAIWKQILLQTREQE